MSDLRLVLRRAEDWARRKKQPFNADLLEEILRLRELHDGLAPGHWPAGSVEHLLLERWPGHGQGQPDPELIGQTLESYWNSCGAAG